MPLSCFAKVVGLIRPQQSRSQWEGLDGQSTAPGKQNMVGGHLPGIALHGRRHASRHAGASAPANRGRSATQTFEIHAPMPHSYARLRLTKKNTHKQKQKNNAT